MRLDPLSECQTLCRCAVRNGRILLAWRAIEPYKGAWDIVGGFLKPDERPDGGVQARSCRGNRAGYPDHGNAENIFLFNMVLMAAIRLTYTI